MQNGTTRGHADVFVLDDEACDDDQAMPATEDDALREEEMRALGRRIAAAASRADEDHMSDRPVTPTLDHASSASVRSGLTARLHTSQGSRNSTYSQRPQTAEQRHLTERVDSNFVVSTEAAIDEMVNEDFDAAEEEEERMLLQSSQGGRPATAAAMSIVPPLRFAATAIFEDQAQAEQDEAAFYEQIIATARSRPPDSHAGSSTPVRKKSSSSNGSHPAPAASPSDSSRASRQGSARRAHSGIPRTSPSSSPIPYSESGASHSPAPRLSPELSARRPPTSSSLSSYSSESSRPPSRGPAATPASSQFGSSGVNGITPLMRQMQLASGGASPVGEWSDRLAREQDIERRRHVGHHAIGGSPSPLQRTSSYTSSSTENGARASGTSSGGVKFPKLK